MRVSVLGFVRASVRNKHGFHAFIFNKQRYGKSTDYYARHIGRISTGQNEELMEWLRTDRNGFPYWEDRATFNMYPHYGMLDLMNAKIDMIKTALSS